MVRFKVNEYEVRKSEASKVSIPKWYDSKFKNGTNELFISMFQFPNGTIQSRQISNYKNLIINSLLCRWMNKKHYKSRRPAVVQKHKGFDDS